VEGGFGLCVSAAGELYSCAVDRCEKWWVVGRAFCGVDEVCGGFYVYEAMGKDKRWAACRKLHLAD